MRQRLAHQWISRNSYVLTTFCRVSPNQFAEFHCIFHFDTIDLGRGWCFWNRQRIHSIRHRCRAEENYRNCDFRCVESKTDFNCSSFTWSPTSAIFTEWMADIVKLPMVRLPFSLTSGNDPYVHNVLRINSMSSISDWIKWTSTSMPFFRCNDSFSVSFSK